MEVLLALSLVGVLLTSGRKWKRWDRIAEVQILEIEADGKLGEHSRLAHVVEKDGSVCRLHVQVDVPAMAGYLQSWFRQEGSKVILSVTQ